MNPAQRLLIAAIVLLSGAVGYVTGRALFRPSQEVIQPIAFNHDKHVEEVGIDCNYCHEFYEAGNHAGLPGLQICLGCHEEPQTESPEEQKIVDLSSNGQEEVFRKLFHLPDNAFYSHRRHAGIAGIPCETCHGDIAHSETPPTRPLVRIDMDFCMDCHEEQEISQDCTRCHR